MIKLVDVSKYYHDNGSVVIGLRNINLEFHLGEFVAITGESGSGKSTLLNVISGVDTYENGEMYIDGKETSYYDEKDWEEHRRNKIGFIFQNYNLIDSYNCLENVEAALIIQGMKYHERKQRAKEILIKVGLGNHLHHKATKLSGGQKQRLAIARALAKDTKIIVADEPTGNLDSESGKEIIKLLSEISKEKLVIIVTHNYEEVSQLVTRKIRIYDSEIAEDREIKPSNTINYLDKKENPKLSFFKKSLTFALLNLKGQPKKSIFLLFTTIFISFFVIIFLMTNIVTSFAPNQRSNQVFYNNYEERVVATKINKKSFSNNDIDKILEKNHVNSVIKSNILVDNTFQIINTNSNATFYCYYNSYKLISKEFLISGRMPENENEALFYFYGTEEFFESEILNNEFYLSLGNRVIKIVGRTSKSLQNQNVIYLSDEVLDETASIVDFLSDLRSLAIKNEYGNIDYMYSSIYSFVYEDKTLANNTIKYSDVYTDGVLEYKSRFINVVSYNDPFNYHQKMYLSSDLYNLILNEHEVFHITINLNDPDKYYSLKSLLLIGGLYSTSPYIVSSNYGIVLDFLSFVAFFLICSIGLSLIYLAGYVIIKAVMMSKKKDYTILRSIGTDSKTILFISKLEIILLFITGFILVVLTIIILKMSIKNIHFQEIMTYLEFSYFVYSFIVHIILALLVSRRFNKALMKKSLLTNMKVY